MQAVAGELIGADVVKLLINVLAAVVLLLYMRTLDRLADIAARPGVSGEDLAALQTPSVAIHTTLALLLQLIATVLAVYKPRGRTPFVGQPSSCCICSTSLD